MLLHRLTRGCHQTIQIVKQQQTNKSLSTAASRPTIINYHPTHSASRSITSSSSAASCLTRLPHTVQRTIHTTPITHNDVEPSADELRVKAMAMKKAAAEKRAKELKEAAENPITPTAPPASSTSTSDASDTTGGAQSTTTNHSSTTSSTTTSSPTTPQPTAPLGSEENPNPTQSEVNSVWGVLKRTLTSLEDSVHASAARAGISIEPTAAELRPAITPIVKVKTRPHLKRTEIPRKDWSQDPQQRAEEQMKADQAKAAAAESEAAEDESAAPYTGPTALVSMEVDKRDLAWHQRTRRVLGLVKSLGVHHSKKLVTSVVDQSEALKKTRAELEEKVEDAKERWETSQDPRIWKLRDRVDMVVGESETGLALGEIMANDPNWDYLEFLKEMEEVMIPEVIRAFRVGDQKFLRQVTEGDAARTMLASFSQRAEQKVYWDERILDIRGVEIVKASLHEDVPFIQLSFVCQHVACQYDAKTGEPVDELKRSVIENCYYAWAIKRDYDSPYYDWKIFEFQCQQIKALI